MRPQDEIRLDYLKHIIKWRTIANIFIIPELIVMWWLGYYHAMAIYLIFIIIKGLLFGNWSIKQEKELNIN